MQNNPTQGSTTLWIGLKIGSSVPEEKHDFSNLTFFDDILIIENQGKL